MTRLRLRRQFIRPWYVPTPGEDGDEMAFIYDGATFTAGTLTPDSGERDVTIELTLASASIASGIAYTWVGVSEYAAFGTLPFATANSQVYGVDELAMITAYDQASNRWAASLIVPAAAGKMEFLITLGNDGAAAINHYVFVLLPNGGVAVSAAISCPGVGS